MKSFNNIIDKPKVSEDDDDEYGSSTESTIRLFNDTKVMNDVDAYIDSEIKGLGYYRNILQYMRKMEEWDKLTIYLNSPGGYLVSTMELIEGMQQSKGSVRVIVSGHNSSAATMIALGAPELIINPSCTMMLHAANWGLRGKMNEVYSRFQFEHSNMVNYIWTIYEGFITRKEFEEMIEGKDFYLTNEEIFKRLELRSEWQQTNNSIENKK